jgi:hypothetical protein
LTVGWARIHPFHPLHPALAACGLERFLDFLFASFFLDFLEALLQLFSFRNRFGLGLLCCGDIPRTLGVPTLFHIQVSGSHFGGIGAAKAA